MVACDNPACEREWFHLCHTNLLCLPSEDESWACTRCRGWEPVCDEDCWRCPKCLWEIADEDEDNDEELPSKYAPSGCENCGLERGDKWQGSEYGDEGSESGGGGSESGSGEDDGEGESDDDEVEDDGIWIVHDAVFEDAEMTYENHVDSDGYTKDDWRDWDDDLEFDSDAISDGQTENDEDNESVADEGSSSSSSST